MILMKTILYQLSHSDRNEKLLILDSLADLIESDCLVMVSLLISRSSSHQCFSHSQRRQHASPRGFVVPRRQGSGFAFASDLRAPRQSQIRELLHRSPDHRRSLPPRSQELPDHVLLHSPRSLSPPRNQVEGSIAPSGHRVRHLPDRSSPQSELRRGLRERLHSHRNHLSIQHRVPTAVPQEQRAEGRAGRHLALPQPAVDCDFGLRDLRVAHFGGGLSELGLSIHDHRSLESMDVRSDHLRQALASHSHARDAPDHPRRGGVLRRSLH